MEKDLEGDDDQLKELVAVLLKFIETLHVSTITTYVRSYGGPPH